jgi:hypothetical protein
MKTVKGIPICNKGFYFPIRVSYDEDLGAARPYIKNINTLSPDQWRDLRAMIDRYYESHPADLLGRIADIRDEERLQAHVTKRTPHDACPHASTCGWIYLIASGSLVKIGRSREVEKRRRAIACDQPGGAELIAQFHTEAVTSIEMRLHARFAHRHVRGEWFDLSAAELEWLTGIPARHGQSELLSK